MGSQLTDMDKVELKTQLIPILQSNNLFNDKNVNTIYTAIIEVLEANSRWIQINQSELEDLSKRFSKKIPSGNFQINFGRILVRRYNGAIYREYFSENTIVKGWHRQLINTIRNKHALVCNANLSTQLFDLGQKYILKNKEGNLNHVF